MQGIINRRLSLFKALAKESDGRLKVLASEKDQEIFRRLGKENLTVHPWEEVHPSLFAIVHVSNKYPGMRMIKNYLNQFHERTGFQSFGRVRMNLITPAYVAEKLSASVGDTKRCRSSLLREALTDLDILRLIPNDVFAPKVGAGAENLNINLSFDARARVLDMTVDQFVELAYHFEKWPFKPANFDVSAIDPDFKHRKRM
ncbi:3692_t:CDS:2 [Acaulospora colombiana]|uniref:3692_t:CDS:1 n=1 Tax=Acaulospora colombiana TaxID=27376 RepID=A0ACA9KQP9_9GLOM|nr:3692_t:CDS:2 [Acaulospora colombiana]